MNQTKTRAHQVYVVLSTLRALAIAVMVTALWNDIDPSRPLVQSLCGLVTFISIIRFSSLGRSHAISGSSMLVGLDMQYPGISPSPFIASETNASETNASETNASETEDTTGASGEPQSEWNQRLLREEKKLRAWEIRRLTTLAGSMLVPTLAAALLLSKAPINIASAMTDAKNLLTALTGGMTLEILEGAAPKKTAKDQTKGPISLSTSYPPMIELIPSNMLRLTIIRVEASSAVPVIILKPEGTAPPISIQMSPSGSPSGPQNIWTAEFSAAETSELIIPSVSSKPAAKLLVSELPTPKVQMTLNAQGRDTWPDHELLPLAIHVTSVHPLDKVQLKITTKQKVYQESVLNISGVTTSVDTVYKLNLQPWMEEDIVEFDIVAEATDRAEPSPLVGTSQPIHLKVASAYGRYKQALETLKKVRSMIDDARSSGHPLPPNVDQEMKSVLQQSEETPFFDGIDRAELGQLSQKMTEAKNSPSASKIHELSDDIGEFLLEHEILDDRERDRDFFIAIRSFSRILEKPTKERLPEAKYLAGRMQSFLDERQKRWTLRVKFLGEGNAPSSWPRISRDMPFKAAVKRTLAEADANAKAAQGHLSSLASEYRAWIEELEAKEDQVRASQEKERQQGLANARNDLRELQQRQDQISQNLDRANERPADVEQKWPASRASENSNVKQASGLLGKLRALSPKAGDRLEAAIQSMELALKSGEGSKWADAESSADLAGRLLRDADQAASKSQKQRDRGRRRRTGGDDYHGTSIGGQIEIKSEYRVDPRYREEILRDVENEMSSGENKAILDGWLHEVVR